MILVDTSVWVGHFRAADPTLAGLLDRNAVLIHPFVIGELAMGGLRNREALLADLSRLPAATLASDGEVLAYIDRDRLHGRGIGYIDAHLLASVRLTAGARLWTGDGRLAVVAANLSLLALPD